MESGGCSVSVPDLNDLHCAGKPLNGAGGEVWQPSSPRMDDCDEAPPPADHDAPPDVQAAGTSAGPTADEPLRGLKHLGPIALFGRQRIHEIAQQPISYIWQDVAVAGTIVVIAGPVGHGKTTVLFLILAARLNTGEAIELFGRRVEPVPVGKYVVLIEGEHSEASTARKLLKSLRLLGVADDALNRIIIVARKAVRLGSPQWGDVCALSAKGLVSDIAIDTVARVAPADANDEREQVAVFGAIAEAIELAPDGEPKPTAWTVAHTRKNDTTGDLSDVGGSVQRTGQADTVLMIKGTKADGKVTSSKVTFAKLREDPDDYPMPVSFAVEGDALRVDGAVRDDRPLPDRVLDMLQHGPLTKSALCTKLGRNAVDLEPALSSLFAERAIETRQTKIAGRDRKVFAAVGFRASDEASDVLD